MLSSFVSVLLLSGKRRTQNLQNANIRHSQLQGQQNTTNEVSLHLFWSIYEHSTQYFDLHMNFRIFPYKSFQFNFDTQIVWAPCGLSAEICKIANFIKFTVFVKLAVSLIPPSLVRSVSLSAKFRQTANVVKFVYFPFIKMDGEIFSNLPFSLLDAFLDISSILDRHCFHLVSIVPVINIVC